MKNSIQRVFIPGSEWFYLKIYCNSSSADKILTNEISKILQTLNKKKKCQKWFFIRYSDPYFHLRLRILIGKSEDFSSVSEQIYKRLDPLIKQGIVYKIQLDTYSREIERYTEKLMQLSESLFHIDSIYTLKILQQEAKTSLDPDSNWKYSLRMIDDLLSIFDFAPQQKLELLKFLDHSFKSEFGFAKTNSKEMNDLYRQYRHDIDLLFASDQYFDHRHEIKKILDDRKTALKSIAHKILEEITTKNEIPIDSYIHMMMNRLFPSRNRAYELIVYSFLYNSYRSALARIQS